MSQNDEQGRPRFGAGHNSQHMTPEDRRALYDREIALYLERRLDRISREEVAQLGGVNRLKAFTEGYLLASIQYCRENWKADCAPTVLLIINTVAEASKGGFCSISLERFSALLQRKPDTISAAIDRLVKLGAIEVERRPGASAMIWPLLPRLSVPIDNRQIVAGIFAITPSRPATDVAPRGRRREGVISTRSANGTPRTQPDGGWDSPPVSPRPVDDSPPVEQGGVDDSPPVEPLTAPRSARDDLSSLDLSSLTREDTARPPLCNSNEQGSGYNPATSDRPLTPDAVDQRTDELCGNEQQADDWVLPIELLVQLINLQSPLVTTRYDRPEDVLAELRLIARQQPIPPAQSLALVEGVVRRLVNRAKPINANLVGFLQSVIAKDAGKLLAARREGERTVEARQGSPERFAETEQLANVGGQALKGRHGNDLLDRVPGATKVAVLRAMEATKLGGRNLSVAEVLGAVERTLKTPPVARPGASTAPPRVDDLAAMRKAAEAQHAARGGGPAGSPN